MTIDDDDFTATLDHAKVLIARLQADGRIGEAAAFGALLSYTVLIGNLQGVGTVSAGDPPDGKRSGSRAPSPAAIHRHKYDTKTGACSCGKLRERNYSPRKGHQFDVEERIAPAAPSTHQAPAVARPPQRRPPGTEAWPPEPGE